MKYIKTFENIDDRPDLYWLLCNFLDKMEKPAEFSIHRNFYDRNEKKGVAVAFRAKYLSSRTSDPVFSIRLLSVNDKQLRDTNIKSKLKIHLDCCYDDSFVKDKQFLSSLKNFIINVFTKYSYFNKKNVLYGRNNAYTYDFYIHTSDINNIMNELSNDFEIYADSDKYNL